MSMMNKIVEDYILMESVGKGQYGSVYRAEHRKTKQQYAIKVMSSQKFKQTPKLKQFTNNQISILTKIHHPNIIKFIQMLRTTNNYYLVYQYCNGGTLSQYIKLKKKLSEQESIKIFIQLRSAFQLLNRQKIMHRDLKPTNILFHNGVVKVADFGFCKDMMDKQLTETMVGSPIYMAPEVLRGSVYDNRADIWSLGVIFYEMLYGFCPYEQSSIAKLIGLIDNTLLKFPPQIAVSHRIQVLLKRMMTPKYRQRINADQLLKYPLTPQLQPLSPGSTSPSALARSQRVIHTMTLKDVMAFNRKVMTYVAETLEELTRKLEGDRGRCLQACFLVYKILSSIQKDIGKTSPYWEFTKTPNNEDSWDIALKSQIQTLQSFGQAIKQSLLSTTQSLPMRMQIQSSLLNFTFYMQTICQFNNHPVTITNPTNTSNLHNDQDQSIFQQQMKNRLINCLLINRHYILVMERKIIDFTDFVDSKKSVEEKEDICKKFAFTRT